MPFDYGPLRATAKRLLTRFGRSVVLDRAAGDSQSYDPVNGTFSGSSATLSGVGVLVPFSANELNMGTIVKSDRKLIYQGDKLEVGDKYGDWRVHDLTDIDPDESGVIIQIGQMRK